MFLRLGASSGRLRPIAAGVAQVPPAAPLRRIVSRSARADGPVAASRDHALSVHRFVGVVQILGGGTLASAYALGGASIDVDGASIVLVALGVAQLILGLVWLLRARVLQRAVGRGPGRFVAAMLAAAAVVAAVGGSHVEALWITSAQCWLVAAGAALPGLRRLAVAALLVTVSGSLVWVLVDGRSGGYDGDGDYVIAIVAMAKVVVVGLWYGQVAGRTWRLLERWHVLEVQERGVVQRMRDALEAVDRRSATLAAHFAELPAAAAAEVATLRSRLTQRAPVREAASSISLGAVADELRAAHGASESALPLKVVCSSTDAEQLVSPIIADAISSTVRRQLGNIAGHVPEATVATVAMAIIDAELYVTVTDDGQGAAPARTGTGTAWSVRQLARVGGASRYYDGEHGVAFEVRLPLAGRRALSSAPDLSLERGMDRFGHGILSAVRWSGYVGDTIVAHSVSASIGPRWLLMPAGALLIEAVLRWGVPGLRDTRTVRLVGASLLSIALVLVFTVPADSPSPLVPATTSVVVTSLLLFERQLRLWLGSQVLRLAAALPLVHHHGSGVVELAVIYPILFSGLVFGLRRFADRARSLERSVLDAFGRASLASAAVHSLSLRHDAIDVLTRADAPPGPLHDAGVALEDALGDVQQTLAERQDPRDVIREGIEAAFPYVDRLEEHRPTARIPPRLGAAGALDRIALAEVAVVAAAERASCAPTGVLGRRRLRAFVLEWSQTPGGRVQLDLRAEPHLRGPDMQRMRELEAVAGVAGVDVEQRDDGLRLLLPTT